MAPQAEKRFGDLDPESVQQSLASPAETPDVAISQATPLRVLNALISIADATQDMATLLERALETLLAALAAQRAVVYLREGELWVLRVHRGLTQAAASAPGQLTEEDLFQTSAPKPGPACCGPIQTPPILGQTFEGCRRAFCLPLLVREQVIGVVLAGLHGPLPPFWEDENFLAALGRTIGLAVDLARPGDFVIIAGKGHEPYQEIGGTKHPFDDRQVAREALRARRG